MELTELKSFYASVPDNEVFKSTWCTDVKLSSLGMKANVVIYKMSRIFVSKKAELENEELAWGEWIPGFKGYFIRHKDKQYARFYPGDGIANVEYIVLQRSKEGNLKEYKLTKEELIKTGWVNAYTLQSKGKPECFTVNVENVIGVERKEG